MLKFNSEYLAPVVNGIKRNTYRLLLEEEMVEKIKKYHPGSFHKIGWIDDKDQVYNFNFDKKLKITRVEIVNLMSLKVEKLNELKSIYNLEKGKDYLFLKLSFCLVSKEARGFR